MISTWWDLFDRDDQETERPSRLFDQHFGLGLGRDDLLNSPSLRREDLLGSLRSTGLRSGYLRPWRHLLRQNSGISSVQADKDSFQVILDVQQFGPGEITVKTVDRTIVVEAKHEEKQDEHGVVSRHFVRKYLLPQDSEIVDVASTLSSDGILTITAPRRSLPAPGERMIPITPTGPARPPPAVEPAASTPATQPASTGTQQIPITQASSTGSIHIPIIQEK